MGSGRTWPNGEFTAESRPAPWEAGQDTGKIGGREHGLPEDVCGVASQRGQGLARTQAPDVPQASPAPARGLRERGHDKKQVALRWPRTQHTSVPEDMVWQDTNTSPGLGGQSPSRRA